MIDACAGFIDAGRARFIAVDGIDWQSWTNHAIAPPDRARRHDAYDRYLADEVVPFFRELTGWERGWATGASMGGYHAANVVFRTPDKFDGSRPLRLYQLGLFVGDEPARRSTATARWVPAEPRRPVVPRPAREPGSPSSVGRARTRSDEPTPGRSATCSPRRASRRSSTSGATTLTTTGPGGAGCCRTTSNGSGSSGARGCPAPSDRSRSAAPSARSSGSSRTDGRPPSGARA